MRKRPLAALRERMGRSAPTQTPVTTAQCAGGWRARRGPTSRGWRLVTDAVEHEQLRASYLSPPTQPRLCEAVGFPAATRRDACPERGPGETLWRSGDLEDLRTSRGFNSSEFWRNSVA